VNAGIRARGKTGGHGFHGNCHGVPRSAPQGETTPISTSPDGLFWVRPRDAPRSFQSGDQQRKPRLVVVGGFDAIGAVSVNPWQFPWNPCPPVFPPFRKAVSPGSDSR
jgi:hypothetical protein